MEVRNLITLSKAIRKALEAFEFELTKEQAYNIPSPEKGAELSSSVKVPKVVYKTENEQNFDPEALLEASRDEMINYINSKGLDFDPTYKKRETIREFLETYFRKSNLLGKEKRPAVPDVVVPEVPEVEKRNENFKDEEFRRKQEELATFLQANAKEDEVLRHFQEMGCDQNCYKCPKGDEQVLKCYAKWDHPEE